jgi:FkbM family methyltransferase
MISASMSRLEAAGTLANDLMASTLTVGLCRPAETFVDVGAHIGSVIAEVARHCPGSRIVAFEAIPEKVEHLRRAFPGVELHSCALGESDGEATFFVNTRRSGFSSLGRPSDADRADVAELVVPLRTLDGFLASDQVGVIKIDVEGAELGVLRGGDRLVAASRPTIMFESGPQAEDGLGYSKQDLWEWFADREYAVLVPNRVAHEDPGLGREGFLESHLYPRRTTNYFAVPRERRVEIRDRARIVLGL